MKFLLASMIMMFMLPFMAAGVVARFVWEATVFGWRFIDQFLKEYFNVG